MANIQFKLNGGSLSPVRELNWGVTRIGRGDDNDIQVADNSVSWHHCQMELGQDALVVRDCGSRNGTHIDERRITEAQLLAGQSLRIGDIEAVVANIPVKITVPDIHLEKRSESVKLGDGTESCTNHPLVRASWRCTNCKKIICNTCVHDLHIKGRPSHKLCPLCSHHCEAILWDDGKNAKKSLWGKLKGVFSK